MIGAELMRETERMIMLNVIDNQWKDHLLSMDHLKEGIGLRGYGQKDPLIEYKKESYVLFQDMMDRIEDETIRYLFFLQVTTGDRLGRVHAGRRWRRRRAGHVPVLPFSPDGMKTRKKRTKRRSGGGRGASRRAQGRAIRGRWI